MIKVMCAKAELIPAQVPADGRVFSYFKGAKRAGVGTIANRWHGALKTEWVSTFNRDLGFCTILPRGM